MTRVSIIIIAVYYCCCYDYDYLYHHRDTSITDSYHRSVSLLRHISCHTLLAHKVPEAVVGDTLRQGARPVARDDEEGAVVVDALGLEASDGQLFFQSPAARPELTLLLTECLVHSHAQHHCHWTHRGQSFMSLDTHTQRSEFYVTGHTDRGQSICAGTH